MALGWRTAIHREGQAQASPIAPLQGVATDQARPHGTHHRLDAGQGLQQQGFLEGGCLLGQGHQGLHRLHRGTAGPEITAGVQGGEAGIEPGVVHQGREAIHALEQPLPASPLAHQGRILRRRQGAIGVQAGQGSLQGCSGQLGRTAAASHGLPARRGHGGEPAEARHELAINPILPLPQETAGAQSPRAIKGQGPGTTGMPAAITEQLQGPGLGPPSL